MSTQQNASKRLPRFSFGRPLRIAAGVLAALVVAWLAFAWLAVDPLARWLVPKVAQEQLASRASVQKVSLDPWRLALTVEGLQLTRPDGAPLAGLDRLEADFEASSLWRWAWHFSEIKLVGPRARLEVGPNGRLNWADLLAAVAGDPKAAKPPSDTLPRVLVDRLAIEAGSVDYLDRDQATPLHLALQPLGLVLEQLSTLPSDRGRYLVQASLPEQGGTLRWKGDIALNPLASSGEVDLQGVRLARLRDWVADAGVPLAAADGQAATRFAYRFDLLRSATGPQPRVQLDQLELALDKPDVSLRASDGATLRGRSAALKLAVPSLLLAPGSAQPLKAERVSLSLDKLAVARGPAEALADKVAVDLALQSNGKAVGVPAFSAEVGGIELATGPQSSPLARVGRIRLEGGSVETSDRRLKLDSLVVAGLQTQVLRPGTNRPLNWEEALASFGAAPQKAAAKPGPTQPAAPSPAKQLPATPQGGKAGSAPAGSTPSANSRPWQVALGRLALEDTQVRLEDRSTPKPTVLELRSPSIELRDLSTDLSRPLPLKAQVQSVQGGSLEVEGRLAPAPLKVDLQLRLRDLSIRPLAPYLNQVARLRLDGGFVNLRGQLMLEDRQGELRGNYRGGAGLRQLAISEEGNGASFLAWQNVASDTLQLQLSPPRVQVQSLRVVRPVGRFIIHEDGSLNVTQMLRSSPASAPAGAAAPASSTSARKAAPPKKPAAPPAPVAKASPPARAASGPGMAISVERVSVDNASLEFADLSLRPQFGTNITALSGVVNGLSNNPASVAQVELDGRVEDFGSARVRGTVQPFQASEFTDLRLSFRNLEMTHLTPYSGKFAGRRIDSGKLSVDLEYKIKERKLAGENKFVIQQLKLGERIDSPDALKLPLDLAIAVLQDSDGVIDLDLPISGSLDDPQFSYGRIVWKAIANVLTRIVTAPFRALGRLLGGDSEKAGDISFDAGSAALAPQEREKLEKIARALEKRPSLQLTIVPTYDTAADTRALQEQAMRRAVLEEAGVKLRPGELPGPLDLGNAKVQSAVERQLRSRSGGRGFNLKLLDDMKDALRTPKPEDLPRYQQMAEQLRPTYPVTPAQLAELATARAGALRNYLASDAKLPASRMVVAPAPVAGSGDGQAVPLKLQLNAAAAAPAGSGGAPAAPALPAR